MNGKRYIDVRITATSDKDLEDLLIALKKIQWCGDVGVGRTLPLYIDGDGSGQSFDKDGNKIKLHGTYMLANPVSAKIHGKVEYFHGKILAVYFVNKNNEWNRRINLNKIR